MEILLSIEDLKKTAVPMKPIAKVSIDGLAKFASSKGLKSIERDMWLNNRRACISEWDYKVITAEKIAKLEGDLLGREMLLSGCRMIGAFLTLASLLGCVGKMSVSKPWLVEGIVCFLGSVLFYVSLICFKPKHLFMDGLAFYRKNVPISVVANLKIADDRKLFDSYRILAIEERRPNADPLLVGTVEGDDNVYLIDSWGDDIKVDDVI